jgi:O-methyltransferase
MRKSQYIELLKHVLIDYHRMDLGEYRPLDNWRYINNPNIKIKILHGLNKVLKIKKYAVCKYEDSLPELRLEGKDWPTYADTMIGLKRLKNIEMCFNEIVKNNIQGDFIETGVWRGGATIFMKALLKDANIGDRIVWVANSFQGLPKPNEEQYEADRNVKFHAIKMFAVSLEAVKNNF